MNGRLVGCSSGSPSTLPDLAVSPDLSQPSGNPDLAGVTWTNFAQPFFQDYCVSCHNPAGQASQQDSTLFFNISLPEAGSR